MKKRKNQSVALTETYCLVETLQAIASGEMVSGTEYGTAKNACKHIFEYVRKFFEVRELAKQKNMPCMVDAFAISSGLRTRKNIKFAKTRWIGNTLIAHFEMQATIYLFCEQGKTMKEIREVAEILPVKHPLVGRLHGWLFEPKEDAEFSTIFSGFLFMPQLAEVAKSLKRAHSAV